MNPTISLCMIVKNEEKILEKCLRRLSRYVDEIIIVDTGSSDNTVEIARKFTDKIKHFEWIDDFSAARNYAISFATMEYILSIDADDFIENPERLKDEIRKCNLDIINFEKLNLLVDYDMMNDKNHINSALKQSSKSYQEKLFKNRIGLVYEGKVHETIRYAGKDGKSKNPEKQDYGYSNLRIFHLRNKKNNQSKIVNYHIIGLYSLEKNDQNCNNLANILYNYAITNDFDNLRKYLYKFKHIIFEERVKDIIIDIIAILQKNNITEEINEINWRKNF